MEIYINGSGVISPQATYDETSFSLTDLKVSAESKLVCLEPEYKNYINPSLLRRMSRMIKMGITSSKICLQNSGIEMPGAIITATGLGCIEDTEKFILSIRENKEQLLTPTAFIQSTHNTVGGQIALLLGCNEYNYTYVHRGLSFESALLDASMMIMEGTADNILTGGIDELTNNSFSLLSQLGIYSTKKTGNMEFPNGTAGGEGAAFFMLSGKKTATSKAKIRFIKTFPGYTTSSTIAEHIQEELSYCKKKIQDIDLVLTGDCGDKKSDLIYTELKNEILKESKTESYKQYCGEYHTASSFALWLALQKLSAHQSVLIVNQFGGADYSIILLEKC